MAWTDIDKPIVPQLIDAAYLNAFKDDINYLHAPNFATYHHPGTGANFTVTSNLGQDVDSAFNLSLTTYGGLIKACFYGQINVASGSARLSIIREDSVSHIGRNLFNDYDVETDTVSAGGTHRGWIKYFPNVPAGTHTFKLIWGIDGSTATMHISHKPRMSVWEV
jgi:hypothetical protein